MKFREKWEIVKTKGIIPLFLMFLWKIGFVILVSWFVWWLRRQYPLVGRAQRDGVVMFSAQNAGVIVAGSALIGVGFGAFMGMAILYGRLIGVAAAWGAFYPLTYCLFRATDYWIRQAIEQGQYVPEEETPAGFLPEEGTT